MRVRLLVYWIIFLFILLNGIVAKASEIEAERPTDLSLWTWFQVYKDLGENSYMSVQYQLRKNNNMSTFQANNFYFIYGYNLTKRASIETLYQVNTNHTRSVHTLYLGLTRQFKINKRVSLYGRTAIQHSRNYAGIYQSNDALMYDWRNRLRVKFKFNKSLSYALSAEPTIRFSPAYGLFVDKIRFTNQLSFNYNKYQSVTLFYIYQPDFVTYFKPKTSYVLGITYQLNLPNSFKKYKKILKPNFNFNFKEDFEDTRTKDLF